MKRRQFLKSTGLSLVAASPLARGAMDCYVQRPTGAQLFTVREALKADPDLALENLAASGVRDVELYGLTGAPELFGLRPAMLRRMLNRHNLTMTCTHVSADALDIPALAENAHALGIETVVLALAPGFMQSGPQGLRVEGPQNKAAMNELAGLLDRLGVMLRREGLQFAYHNHHVEFFEVDGEIPYNYIMWNTDPQTVRCELDIGWLALAGVDYLAVLDTFGNRTVACHLKDFDGKRPVDMGDVATVASHLVAPGQGVVNFAAVLERMDYYNIRHGFLEIDQPTDAFADLRNGVNHLQRLRPC